ncbi:unnamed protein product [Malus baccata var. baccata]
MAIKLDMAKAYDRVEWDFLLGMMVSLGFARLFCSWIKECISTVSFSVLINGSLTGFFRPNRGLRQGDPLSPFLFLLCIEGFSMLIKRSLEMGALHGFKISPTGVPLTHIFFADDSVVFENVSVEEADSIVAVLQTYARGSGQVINLAKSSVFFGANIPKCKKAKIQYLSQARKEILVKSVALALPNYAMSCFRLPIGVCRDVERAIRNYWWRGNDQRKGIHWVSWDRLMKQKKAGGMGFKDIQCVNLALLAKIGWRITQNPLSLIASVLRDKYFPGKTFGEAPKGKNTSWGWKGLFEARKVLNLGLRWRVGNGKSINIRKDPWFPKPSTFKVIPKPNLEETMVCDLIDPVTNSWRSDLIEFGFQREDVLPILSIPLSHAGIDDRLVWHYATNGIFSVKIGFQTRSKVSFGAAATMLWRHVFWFCSPLHLNSHALEGCDFLESWSNFCAQVKDRNNADDIRQEFAFGLWRLWKHRNEVIFKGIHCQPLDILEAWGRSTSEYKVCLALEVDDYSPRLPKTIKVPEIICTKWQKPRFGTIKINSDAAWCKDTMRMGVGWLGRDFAGLLQAAGGIGSGFCHSVAAAEASAIRYALLACIDHGFNDIIIESDASSIIKMLKKEGNRAAYSVAKYAFKEGRSFSWDCIGPDFLFNILAKDAKDYYNNTIHFTNIPQMNSEILCMNSNSSTFFKQFESFRDFLHFMTHSPLEFI